MAGKSLYKTGFQHDNFNGVHSEFLEVEKAFTNLSDKLPNEVTNIAPQKVTDFDMKYADGVNWNPGKGAGLYIYFEGKWNKFTFT